VKKDENARKGKPERWSKKRTLIVNPNSAKRRLDKKENGDRPTAGENRGRSPMSGKSRLRSLVGKKKRVGKTGEERGSGSQIVRKERELPCYICGVRRE